MKKLSERLEDAANLDIHMPIEVRELLEKAADLARSFEAAPISITEHVESNSGSFVAAECDWLMDGKRVRVVPEKDA